MILKAVVAQSIIVTALFAYVTKKVTELECTGSQQLCAEVTNSTPSIVVASIFSLVVFYLILMIVAYFANKTTSKAPVIALAVLETLIFLVAFGSVIAAEGSLAKVMHLVSLLFSVAVLVICAKKLKRLPVAA